MASDVPKNTTNKSERQHHSRRFRSIKHDINQRAYFKGQRA